MNILLRVLQSLQLTLVRLLQGKPPSVHTAVELYNVLSKSDTASLRQPVGLEQQLLKDNEMDSEVGQSMLQLLKVLTATATLLLQAPVESQQTVVTVIQLTVIIHRITLSCRMCIEHHPQQAPSKATVVILEAGQNACPMLFHIAPAQQKTQCNM